MNLLPALVSVLSASASPHKPCSSNASLDCLCDLTHELACRPSCAPASAEPAGAAAPADACAAGDGEPGSAAADTARPAADSFAAAGHGAAPAGTVAAAAAEMALLLIHTNAVQPHSLLH